MPRRRTQHRNGSRYHYDELAVSVVFAGQVRASGSTAQPRVNVVLISPKSSHRQTTIVQNKARWDESVQLGGVERGMQ